VARIPAISIITPTYNRRDALQRAIASVRGQTFEDYEHIVVDDGSADGTADTIAGVRDGRLRFVRFDDRRGANAARNHGIGMAQSLLVTFLDSDDEFLPSRLERSIAFFATHRDIDVSISSFQARKGGTISPIINRRAYFDAEMLQRAVTAQVTAIAGSAITARRHVLEAVRLFDEDLWRLQDRDLLLRLAAAGYGAAIIEEVDWIKHYSPDSISRQHGGYVAAYIDLPRRHPHIHARYPDIAAYMVARRLLNNALQGRFRELLSDYKATRQDTTLSFSSARLVAGYVAGRRQRRQIVREVKALPSPGF